jgi:hypothetical protein
MSDDKFPALEPGKLDATRQAVHAYARVAGAWAKAKRKKRKHWWHASLRPSLYGLTTGVIYGATDFEIELDLASSRLHIRTCTSTFSERLHGQSSADVAATIRRTLQATGVNEEPAPDLEFVNEDTYPGCSADQANAMHRIIGSVAAALEDLRATIREEKSPIQVWPHHFDVSMIWLPGGKVARQDRADEEYADKQMNFGFAFGDDSIPEPYFYVTAYPLPDDLPSVALPIGTTWHDDGFNGAVLLYKDLAAMADPHAYLQGLWTTLLEEGSKYLCTDDEETY